MVQKTVITKDQLADIVDEIKGLIGKQILIGIPDSNAERTDGGISNASIGYLMEFGSPAKNIPARPFLIPGVQKAEKDVLPHLKNAINAALDGKDGLVTRELHAAGEIAVAHVKKRISSNIPPPLKPSTIRGRKYARGTASRRAAENEYAKLVAGGMPPAEAQRVAGITSLVNSGQLRNAITYVVREAHHGRRHRTGNSNDSGLPGNDSRGSMSIPSTRGSAGVGEMAGAAEGAAGEVGGAAEGIAGEIAGVVGAIIP